MLTLNNLLCQRSEWLKQVVTKKRFKLKSPYSLLVVENHTDFVGCCYRNNNPKTTTLVLIAVSLEGACNRHINVVGLIVGELSDDATKAFHHVAGNFFIQVLG